MTGDRPRFSVLLHWLEAEFILCVASFDFSRSSRCSGPSSPSKHCRDLFLEPFASQYEPTIGSPSNRIQQKNVVCPPIVPLSRQQF